jgi:hypothetical protein
MKNRNEKCDGYCFVQHKSLYLNTFLSFVVKTDYFGLLFLIIIIMGVLICPDRRISVPAVLGAQKNRYFVEQLIGCLIADADSYLLDHMLFLPRLLRSSYSSRIRCKKKRRSFYGSDKAKP